MKRNNLVSILFAWLGFALAPTHAVWAADVSPATQPATAQATLTGTVTNSATGRTLEGVRVVLQGTGREEYTNAQGLYRFENVAPGNAVLSISYTGLDTMAVPVVVTPGVGNLKDVGLTAEIYRMSKFVVAGEREGNAQAITLQRLSNGVKTIVSADAYGNVAGNPADLLIRLPGIEGVPVIGDMRSIRIRGMSDNLTTITMDGNRMAAAPAAGAGRNFELDSIGADAIERIEVVKSPTPDMDGDSIAGAVNMISKSAFGSSSERKIRGSIGAIWRPDPREDRAPLNYGLSYSEVFAGKLAVTFNYAYKNSDVLRDQSAQAHQQLAAGVQGPAYTYNLSLTDGRVERKRNGGSLKLDYKLTENTQFHLTTSLNKAMEHNYLTTATFATNQAVATLAADGTLTGVNGIAPGFTETVTVIRAVPNSTATAASINNYRDVISTYLEVGAVHNDQSLNVDYNGYTSYSKTNYAGNKTHSFAVRGVGFTIDKSADLSFPTLTQTGGPDVTRLASYTDNSYNIARMAGWDRYRGAVINAKKDFVTPVPTYVKIGWRIREQTRKLERTPFTGVYVGPDGVMGVNAVTGVNDDNLAQFGQANRPFPDTRLNRYPKLPFPIIPADGNTVDEVLARTPQYFQQNLTADLTSQLTGNQIFDENISAGYIMGNVDLGKVSILGGLRVETTKTSGEGSLAHISPEERARRAAFVGPLTNAEIARRTTAQFSNRISVDGEYRTILPGFHLKFKPFQRLVTRLSYATNIGRPAIGQLIPTTQADDINRTVTSSNPSLKPQTADNFDLSAEYYFEPAGVFSAGVFEKDLKNFIYTAGGETIAAGPDNGFDGNYAGYALTTQRNGGSARIRGLELNYSQQFTFLPGFWSGLGAFANYTKMEAKGNYGTGSAIALTPTAQLAGAPTSEVAGFNPVNANVGISYIKGKASVRFQYNYRGRYLSTFNINQSRLTYTDSRSTLDLKSVYYISRRFNVYLDIYNMLYTLDTSTSFYGGRPSSRIYVAPQVFFGIRANL